MELSDHNLIEKALSEVEKVYAQYPVNTIDGVKIEFENEWVHLRKSNTEPIIRIYAESTGKNEAEELARKVIDKIKALIA